MERAGRSLDDVDVIELNEAFAAQSLAVIKDLELDPREGEPQRRRDRPRAPDRGHRRGDHGEDPVRDGAQDQDLGLVTLCIGGGQGIAMLLSRN